MEMNSSSASVRKVMSHIPNDIAFYVLFKLPLKSLKRFGCVNKAWSLLFQNCYFMNKFRNNFLSNPHPYYNDTSLILYNNYSDDYGIPQSSYYLLSGEKYENRRKLQSPNLFQQENYPPDFTFNGSVAITGIVLLNQEDKLGLWNPATHEIKIIPQSPNQSVPPYQVVSAFIQGCGYNHIKDDFKIIRYIHFFQMSENDLERINVRREDVSWNEISYEPVWEIYSLKCNSWKKLDFEMPVQWEYQTLYLDGMCHWFSRSKNGDEHFLVSFNLNSDMFTTTTIPLDIPSNIVTKSLFKFVQRHLIVLNGSIGSISWYTSIRTISNTSFHISILGELGVKESWTKLFVIEPLLHFDWYIGVGKKGDIFFRKTDGQLFYFDLITQKTEELGVKGNSHNYRISIYKESLHSI